MYEQENNGHLQVTILFLSKCELFRNHEKRLVFSNTVPVCVYPIGISIYSSQTLETHLEMTVRGDTLCVQYAAYYQQILQRIYCFSSVFPSPRFPFSALFWSVFLFPSIILTAAWCQAAGIHSVICVCRCSGGCVHACICSVSVCAFLLACCLHVYVRFHAWYVWARRYIFLWHTCFLTFHLLDFNGPPCASLPAHMKSEVITKKPTSLAFRDSKCS